MNRLRYFIYSVALLLFIAFCLQPLFSQKNIRTTQIPYGQIDYVEYWSAFNLLRQGQNPYSPEVMRDFQSERLGREVPTMMWNPPWLLVFMYPVLLLDINRSTQAWSIIQLVLMLISSIIIISTLMTTCTTITKSRCSLLVLLAFIFMPFYFALAYGQVGTLLLLGSACCYKGLVNRSGKLIILGGLIMSVKPHLFFLFAVAFLFWLCQEKRWKLLFKGAISFSVLLLISELLFPGGVIWWLETLIPRQTEIVPSTFNWVGPTLWGAARAYFGNFFLPFGYMAWLLTALGIAIYMLVKQPKLDWPMIFPLLLALSVYLAPFGWFFDQIVLLPVFLIMLNNCIDKRNWLILGCAILLQVVTSLAISHLLSYQHQLWWYAPVLLLLYYLSASELPKSKISHGKPAHF